MTLPDDGRIGGFERQHAMLWQIYGVLESGAKDSSHELTWAWPLLGLTNPDARPDVHWSPAEASAVIAWHREAAAPETAKRQLMALPEKAKPKAKAQVFFDDDGNIQNQVRAAVKEALQGKPQGPANRGANSKRRRGKLRPGRDL